MIHLSPFLPRTVKALALGFIALVIPCLAFAGPQQGSGNGGYMGHNPEFGKVRDNIHPGQTRSTKIWGCDISKWQGNVNFSQLSGAVSFVVIRASLGAPDAGETSAQYADPKLAQNRAGAEQNGMEVGFYHYAYPEYNSATAEANCFADNVGHLNAGQFVVLDYESSWSGDVVGWCKTWLDTVSNRLGVKPLLYINLSTANAHNWSSVINGNYGLWMARWDYDKNADAPACQWPFTAMRQYSDKESLSGISGNVDGDVFYGDLATLKRYGLQTATPASVVWTSQPVSNRWYRSDEHIVYHVNGDRPNTVLQLVDGNIGSTFDTSDGYMALSYAAPGWHFYEVAAYNAANNGNYSYTGRWTGGWDPNPPTAARTAGAQPSTWYTTAQTVSFNCSDAQAGVRSCHYKWDDGPFSDWVATSTGSVSLIPGKHHLYVEVEDNSFTGTQSLGNRSTIDLGEYWLDTTAASVNITSTIVSNGSTIQLEITVQNPNSAPVDNVGLDLIQLGTTQATSPLWSIGTIGGNSSVKKTLTFATAFGANKMLLLSTNYHIGSNKFRLRSRIAKP